MKAIKKRQPALLTAIRKFNRYCTRLAELHKPEWGIPLPATLPTTLDELRGNGSTILMEDVWITQTPGALPRWLEDADVREGIRAMLKVARCREEHVRIGAEADNLCRWFGWELSAVQAALGLPSSTFSPISPYDSTNCYQMIILEFYCYSIKHVSCLLRHSGQTPWPPPFVSTLICKRRSTWLQGS